jgi:hypothetical protein
MQVTLRGNDPVPLWLSKLRLSTTFQYKRRQLFKCSSVGFAEYPLHGFSDTLKISGVGRAFLELLADVSDESSFITAYELFEGMTSLKPQLLGELLAECKSVKVKRLFFLMLEKSGHRWGEKLDLNNYSLGSGKRHIVYGGKLNRKYAITVPEGFND